VQSLITTGFAEMDEMTIGEVAQLARVQTSTLHYYERIGPRHPSKRWRVLAQRLQSHTE
jgi:hypothetical protein